MKLEIADIYSEDEILKSEDLLDEVVRKLRKKDCDLFEVYNYILPYLWGSESIFTIKNKYGDLKKAIENSSIAAGRKKKFIKAFSIHPNTHLYMNKVAEKNAENRLNNKEEFSVESYIENMKKVKSIIEKKDFDSIRVNRQENSYLLANLSALYFCLATGRRPFEIFKSLDLIKVGKTIFYKGLAKKRDSEEIDYKAFPLDDDYQFLKKCLENIRKYYQIDNFDNKKFNQGVQQTWNKFAKYILEDKNISYSKIRSMYSEVALKKLNVDNLDNEMFRKLVLAHTDIVMSASDYYRKTKAI